MIEYRDSADGVSPQQLHGFFADWPTHPTPETHLELLRASDVVVLAVDETTGAVVGFVTALTDGILTAFLPLLEVRREYQRRGIGRALVERAVSRLSPLYAIDLACDAHLAPYYERLGFHRGTAMLMRNHGVQAGQAHSQVSGDCPAGLED